MKKQFKRIIIFNPFGIGDVLFSTPLVRVLKKRFPEGSISYICNKRAQRIIGSNPNIDDIILYEKDDFRHLAGASKSAFLHKFLRFVKCVKHIRADLMIDLSLNYQASFLAMLLGIPVRIGFNYRKRGKFLTSKLGLEGFDQKHVVCHYLDLLSIIGIDNVDDCHTETFAEAGDISWAEHILEANGLNDKFLIGIIPGGGRSWGEDAVYRRWPTEKFAVVADMLVEKFHASVILFGDSRESGLCEDVNSKMKYKILDMSGKTDIGQFMGMAKKCGLILCNEGGPLHIAASLNIPSVSIFGPVDHTVYGPCAKDNSLQKVIKTDLDCRPCYAKFKHKQCEHLNCLKAISVSDVFNGADELMKKINLKKK